jgi:methylmalonyl-CoA mutase C-terminal domain/subunit
MKKVRILIAKIGLDGHDKGAKIVARLLRDAGAEAIYLGLRRTPEEVVRAAMDEDVDFIGLSVLSGIHIQAVTKIIKKLGEKDAGNIKVIVGGVIPPEDIATLKELGVAAVFPTESRFEDIVKFVMGTNSGGQGP